MKKVIFTLGLLVFTLTAMAQQHLSFPFQGGSAVFEKFFKDSLTVSPEIIKQRAAGTAVFKFTADNKGNITKIIVYHADDYVLMVPIIEALKKTDRKWIIPDHQKLHDFILPFNISFNTPQTGAETVQKEFLKYYLNRKSVTAHDQVPLNEVTLLPTISIKYDIK